MDVDLISWVGVGLGGAYGCRCGILYAPMLGVVFYATGKSRYPFYRRLDGPQGRSGRAENFVPTGIRSRTVQPVVRRYTHSATRSV